MSRFLGRLSRLKLTRGAVMILADSGKPILSSKCGSSTIRLVNSRGVTNPLHKKGADVFSNNAHVPFVLH